MARKKLLFLLLFAKTIESNSLDPDLNSILVKAENDSNLNRINNLLQTLLDYEFGDGTYLADDVLNYGCWCQLDGSSNTFSRHGVS